MLPSVLRHPGDDPPLYGKNSPYFTVEVHHGGHFYEKPNNLVYEGGFVLFMDYVQAAWFTEENLRKFSRAVGNDTVLEFYYKKQMMSLGKGLRRLASKRDVAGMLMDREGHSLLQIYVVAPMPMYALSLHAHAIDDNQTFEDCYVPIVEENEAEDEVDWVDQFFEENAEELWSQYEDSLQYHYGEGASGGDMSAGRDEVVVEDVNEELRGEEEAEGLVESDYEMEHEPAATGEAGSQRVNFDFGFGAAVVQQVRDCDTDYGESDDLRSIQSEEDEGTTPRSGGFSDAFNTRTGMEDPVFRTGLVFESKAILKAAITEHAVRRNREIKYKKDDAIRLRAMCKGDCPWFVYATREPKKTSFVIKTLNEEHTCPMVYRNFRVSSTYLANRYLTDWRSEPNMSVSTFMERVKRDGLGDISAWQVYRTKERALEKIRGSVFEHYRILWDYCEELKRTNIGTTALVEGYAGEFKRLYICLGALKEGFLRGCRRLIGVDGCFLKTEHGGQLLAAVGVDANNGMYPVAYAVVEVENGDNWRWFLGLLKDDLSMHNSQQWTFISDKQKGLVNAIETLFENAEHRTCVRHLYNNFSASHKGLILKNCLWDAARATTVLQWLQHMQRMLDLDQAAYEWLESKPASHWSKSHFREGNKCDMLLNNLCESFNSTIVSAREKPILTMLEEIQIYLMKRIVSRRESSDRWTTSIGPRIQKVIDKNSGLARVEWAEYAGNERFQVRHNAGTILNAVDLRARTCTCRAWQLSRIPCCHVIASIASRGLNVLEYVDDMYKKEAYLMTYSSSISPITGPDSWPNPGLHPLDPPVYTRKAGRPKKNRRKEPNKVALSQSKRSRKASSSQSNTGATSTPRKRAWLIITCRKCGERGHNSRGCKGAPPPARN